MNVESGFTMPHAFSTGSIRAHAPAASGVYGISNRREWIYIGETDNIQARLLEHLAETSSEVKTRSPTGFTFELCDRQSRLGRQSLLVMQYAPVCNPEPDRGRRRNSP
jgi:hypothetical protein